MTPQERASLLDALLDGDISEADFLRLEAELSVDPQVRHDFYRRLQLEMLLEREAVEISDFQPHTSEPKAERRISPVFLQAAIALAIAASILGVVLVTSWNNDSNEVASVSAGQKIDESSDEPADEPSASGFAVLSGQSDAVWVGESIGNGSLLPEGKLHLKSGLIHVELFSGVQMVIQGDAVFSIDSPMQVTMTSGRARAHVPDPAHGFRVKTAVGEVIDLGTEFTIDVNEDRSSVQVVDGEVELRSQVAGTRRLQQGGALQLTSTALTEKPDADLAMVGPTAFQNELAQVQSKHFQRWQQASEALRHDPRLIAYYRVDPDEGWSRRLTNLATGPQSIAGDGAVVAAERTEDRWGRNGAALDFSRMGSRVRVAVPGEHRGLTLLCWVKINSIDRLYNSLFLTDGHEEREPHWQIMNDGRIFFSVKAPSDGGLKADDPKQRVFYSPSFWDASLSGRWVMLCTVYDVDGKRVTHYLNGRSISQETIPDKWLVDSIRIGAASICNWSEPMYRTDPKFVVRNLNGSLDEFAIFSGALSNEEITAHFAQGILMSSRRHQMTEAWYRTLNTVWFSTVAVLLAAAIVAGPAGADEADEREFTLEVLPVLKDKCLGCHGGDEEDVKGEFSVLQRSHFLTGGESEEPAIVPGKPDEGTLIEAITWSGLEMPPKENDRLTEEQIDLFRRWIKAGAPWPDEAKQESFRQQAAAKMISEDGIIVATSGGTSAEWSNRRYLPEDLWAFRPLRSKSELVPDDVSSDKAIDHFIDQRLADAKIPAAPQAAPETLIRRATFDLTGLPPTPEQIDEFKAEWSKDADRAWSDLIQRLLGSPQYGEHWGRHWLDVTRYADTGGMSNDYERSNMWCYRDYVIRAFNEDKPYNDFVIEQVAGDELADQSVRKRKGDDDNIVRQTQVDGDYTDQEAEWIVATGFLRLGPWDNAMVMEDEARQMYLDDVVNVTGQTFLSTTMRCCKCHDHKFDPIPTRDYYRMYAAFSATHMAERSAPLLPGESRVGFEEGRAHVQKMLDFAIKEKNKLVNKREAAARAWFEEHGLPYKNNQQRKSLPDEEKPPRHVGLDYVDQGQLKVREQDEWIWRRRLERYQPMAQSVYNSKAIKMAGNGARKLRISRVANDKPLQSHVLLGGALTALGENVFPGVLSAVSLSVNASSDDPFLVTPSIDGRRLGLAKWIAHPENGLATRSIVNRIWQFHFGVGMAANANNFGAKGAKPSHSELLDYLASDFVDNGWTIKRMHRMIMMSDAYMRAAIPADATKVSEVDPNNRLISYFPRRRLSAEEIRDGILAITGELVHCDGGLPISPEINMEVALQPRMIQFSLAPAYQPSATPEQRNRRTVYAYHVRGQADPFTELFNQPNPNESCELRETAAVTPQVFTMLNSDMMIDRSIALALRLQRECDALPEQIDRAFRLALGRNPAEQEQTWMTKYVADMKSYHDGVEAQPVTYPSSITRSLVEEFTGQPFEYEEILPIFERYHPDKKPSDVSADTRALADMCLLLINSNEFMYVN